MNSKAKVHFFIKRPANENNENPLYDLTASRYAASKRLFISIVMMLKCLKRMLLYVVVLKAYLFAFQLSTTPVATTTLC